MPQETISPGETVELYRAQRARESLFIRNKGSEPVNIAKSESFARDGREIDADDRGDLVFVDRGEPVHVHAPSSNSGAVTVQYESQGFFINYAPRNRIRTTLEDVTVANVPIDVTAVNADVPIKLASGISELDVNLNASTIDVPIKTGAAGNVDINVNQNGSLGTIEQNDDQTANITGGGTVTTTIFADTAEIWELKKIFLTADSLSSGTNFHSFTIQTEQQGIELGFGQDESGSGDGFSYQSGEWIFTGSNTQRDDMVGTQIDDSQGLEVIYKVNGSGDQTNNRTIRTKWEVVNT